MKNNHTLNVKSSEDHLTDVNASLPKSKTDQGPKNQDQPFLESKRDKFESSPGGESYRDSGHRTSHSDIELRRSIEAMKQERDSSESPNKVISLMIGSQSPDRFAKMYEDKSERWTKEQVSQTDIFF